MALTPLPVIQVPAFYANDGAVVTFTAGDASAHNSFTSTNREILIAFNSDTAPHAHTIKSQPDVPAGRTDDITETLTAGEYKVYNLPSTGYALSGLIEIDPSSALLLYAVLRVP